MTMLAARKGGHVARAGRSGQLLLRRGRRTVRRNPKRAGRTVPSGSEIAHLVDRIQELPGIAERQERRIVGTCR